MTGGILNEFNKNAKTYRQNSALQRQVARELVGNITRRGKHILDLGAGDGAVFEAIDWQCESFLALEAAPNMLDLHPAAPEVMKLQRDFNQADFLKNLPHFDLLISSASLQWAQDLRKTLVQIAAATDNVALSIFTDKTFASLRKFAKTPLELPNAGDVIKTCKDLFNAKTFVKNYELIFSSARELFAYIKKTGVSGGARGLNFVQTKDLLLNYRSTRLEVEVVFVVSLE